MSNNEHIKRGLENLKQYEPKPELWNNIETAMDEGDRPKIVYWRWITGIAATIAITLAATYIIKQGDDASMAVNQNPIIDIADTTKTDTQKLAVEFSVPKPVERGNQVDPTTGPWDGEAGQTMGDQNFKITEPVTIDTILTSGSDVQLYAAANDATVANYQWDFGQGTATLNAATYNYAPATTYTVDVQNVTSSDEWELTASPDLYYNTDNAVDNLGKEITNYSKSDNLGYVGTDANADYKSTDVIINGNETQGIINKTVVDRNKLTLRSSEVVKLKTRANVSAKSSAVNRKSNEGFFFSSADKKSPTSTIEYPKGRVLANEKYQTTLSDSIEVYLNNHVYNPEPVNNESYFPLIENEYQKPTQEPLSTFGIDVDNASYAVMRTKINANQIVPKDAVRVEEFINYFDYNYKEPSPGQPFSINLENANCPWKEGHQLVRIALKGKDINYDEKQNSNLVFLIDVSGSMDSENKLPLVKKSMKLLVDQMGDNDRIAIVTYAGAAGLALESTSCGKKDFIKKKIDKLDAGGSTAGGEGIKLAYNIAVKNLISNGNNRVIMCTDGDFNVGQNSDPEMKQLIINNRNKGVFITVCGFGMGNYQDSKMETIADNGNGNYFYIDTYRESEKVFNRDIRATLFTIAKDVKIQVEFNPKHVKAYRLIGYENRKMPPQDFNDDTKDGGELGAGHTVTALYEIIPANSTEDIPGHIDLKYQRTETTSSSDFGNEMLTVKLRYKEPNGSTSMLLEKTLGAGTKSFSSTSQDFQFASGVALYAQQLRQSKFIDQKDFSLAQRIVESSKGADIDGDRQELITLMKKASKNYQVYTKE